MLNPESPSTAPALIDPASKAFQSLLDKLAPTEATVLIVGETKHRQGGGGPLSPSSQRPSPAAVSGR